MKMLSFEDLLSLGYREIMNLPTYSVLQNPKTFHTVLFLCRKTKNDLPKQIVQYIIPGLSDDPDVTIPSGMWNEIVKEVRKHQLSQKVYIDNLHPLQAYNNPALGNYIQDLTDVVRRGVHREEREE